MGRGRKPKPTMLRVLQGNPGKRAFNHEEPAYGPGAPDKPEFLDDFAGEEWDRLIGMLVSARMITKGDGGIILVAAYGPGAPDKPEFLDDFAGEIGRAHV